jgi:hypothetical protein
MQFANIKASLSSSNAGRRSLDSAHFTDVMTASTLPSKTPQAKDVPSSPIHRFEICFNFSFQLHTNSIFCTNT